MAGNRNEPGWQGYLGDYLRGEVGINQLKPQHPFFDALGLEKALSDNTCYHAVLTPVEAQSVLEDLGYRRPANLEKSGSYLFSRNLEPSVEQISPEEAFARGINLKRVTSSVFTVTDYLSTYAGNLHDVWGLYDVIHEFKSFGITAKVFTASNGKKFIHISGYAGLRKIITGTRYGASHPQMLAMGIGQQGLTASLVKGAKFCIFFAVGYRIIESIFKSDYTLSSFLGNVTMDMAKVAISAVASFAVGTVLTAMGILGGSIIAAAVVIVGVGIAATMILNSVDDHYKISSKLIALLKEEFRNKTRTPEQNIQSLFNSTFK